MNRDSHGLFPIESPIDDDIFQESEPLTIARRSRKQIARENSR